MPDIVIKDEVGREVTYFGVETITVPLDEGGTAVFTHGVPKPTESFVEMQSFLLDSSYSKYQKETEVGTLVSSNLTDFGLWLVTRYDVIKLYNNEGWSGFKEVNGGVLIYGGSSTRNLALLYFDYERLQITQLYTSAYSFNHFNPVQEGYIFSGYPSGIYLYREQNKTVERLDDFDYSVNYFKKMDTGFLISSTSNLLYYKSSDNSITHLSSQIGYINYGIQMENGYLFACSSSNFKGLYYFDEITEEVTQVYSELYNYYYFMKLEQGCLVSGSYSNMGILYFDETTKAVTKVYDISYNWQYCKPIEGGYLVSGTNSNTGLLYFDIASKTMTQVYSTGSYYRYYQKLEHGILLGEYYLVGMIYFDFSTKTATKVYDELDEWNFFIPVEGGCLCSNDSSSNTGVLFFNEEDKTLTQIYNYNYNWNKSYFIEGGVLIWSSVSSAYGILYYEYETKTIRKIVSSGYNYSVIIPTTNGILMSGATSGIYFINLSDKTSITLYSRTANLTNWQKTETGYLITSPTTSGVGVLYYDELENIVTQKYARGWGWTEYTKESNGYRIHQKNASFTKTIFWIEDTKSIIEI